MADLFTTAELYMQAPHVAHQAATAAAKCVPSTITQDVIPLSYYLYSILAAGATGVVTAIAGYFVGKRGLTTTQTDLSNVKTAITNVPAEVKKIESEVTAKL